MSDLHNHNKTIGTDNPLFNRAGFKVGVSWIGVEGSTGDYGYKIHLYVCIPNRLPVTVLFPKTQIREVCQ